MKIALCVYRLPAKPTLWGWVRQIKQAQLLRRRAHALLEAGHQPVVLGHIATLQGAVARCRANGAQGLWVSCQSPMRPLRQEYLREPGVVSDLALYVDGLVSPDLPPTAGQLARLASMGFSYLPEGCYPQPVPQSVPQPTPLGGDDGAQEAPHPHTALAP